MKHFTVGELSAYFVSINRNKRSVAIDLRTGQGKEVFYEMVKKADVVYDNFRPGIVEKLKVDYETLKGINPEIICCSISGYGHTGPLKDRPSFDLVLQGISGEMSITGEEGRPPARMGVPMGDLAGGMFAATAIGAALVERERSGKGQKIDISLLDCQISLLSYVAQYYFASGVVPGPIGSGHQSIVPYQAYPTKDRWITIACFTEKFWPILCSVLGKPELATDQRFNTNMQRLKNRRILTKIFEEILVRRTADEWLRILETAKIPSGPINTVDRALADERDMVVDVYGQHTGSFRMVGNPIKSTSLDHSQKFVAPPALGEHSAEILSSMAGLTAAEINQLVKEGVVDTLPGQEEDTG